MQFVLRSRKTLLLTIVIVVMLCGSAFAYLLSLPTPKGPKVTITSSPFELSMALDKSAYSLTDNITISFYLRNISNETVTATMPFFIHVEPVDLVYKLTTIGEGVDTSDNRSASPHLYTNGPDPMNGRFPFGYNLFTSNGTLFDRLPSSGIAEVWSIYFEPHASLNQTLTVNLARYVGLFGDPIKKGHYQMSGEFEPPQDYDKHSTVETPSISFTIG